MSSRTRTGLAIALFLVLTPAGATAQYFEPVARRAGVVVPDAAGQILGDAPLPAAAEAGQVVEGTYPVLIIPALFEDSPEPHVTAQEMQAILFADTGRTMTTYYREASNQRLSVDGSVAPWVRTSVSLADGAGHGWIGPRAQDHFRDAVAAADSAIDFTQFDNDGPDGVPNSGDDDGIVDSVVFMNIELAGNCGGEGFWPHFSGLRNEDGELGVETGDIGASGEPIKVLPYIADSAVNCDDEPLGPAVLAHEFGHNLGLPDYYRQAQGLGPDDRHWIIGCFGIMGAGSWACGSGPLPAEFGPTHFSPLALDFLGWADVEEVGQVTDREYVLEPVQSAGHILRVPLAPGSEEYFLIEYRPRIGFDDVLPDDGVLIYHVDESETILPAPGMVPNYAYELLEADGDSALRKVAEDGGDRGVASDMFARAGQVDSVGRTGAPSTAMHGGLPATLVIHSIQVVNGEAHIRLSTTSPVAATLASESPEPTALDDYEARYTITGGTPPYAAVVPDLGLPVEGLSLAIENSNELVVRGRVSDQGELTIPISVEDSHGQPWFGTHTLHVMDADLTEDQLMEAVVNGWLDSELARYLNNAGNGNALVDLGDVRAYLERTGRLHPGGP